MRLKLIFFTFLLSVFLLRAQTNLVPNPSFENYNTCPNDVAGVGSFGNWVIGWWDSSTTPDYFNQCGDECVSIPYNACGFQYPYDGIAYAGLVTISSDYINAPTYRECISAKLVDTLIIGEEYFFSMQVAKASFSVSLFDSAGGGCSHEFNGATNKMGVLFTTNKYDNINNVPINNFAHIYSDSIITDTTNWTRISGSFIADSAYLYINIGNFFDDAHTDSVYLYHISQSPNSCRAYYYVDSVSLYSESSIGINYLDHTEKTTIFPNPMQSNYFFIKSMVSIQTVFVYNQLGRLMKTKIKSLGNITSKIEFEEEVEKGIYILKLISQNKTSHFSLIKN